MLKLIFNKKINLAIIMMAFAFTASGNTFNAYPGKYKAKLMGVEAANIIMLHIEVWPGYPRSLKVTLPDIAVPLEYPKAPACHTELIQKALNFTNEFMASAALIEVKDIQMENTGRQDALTKVYTDKGSLGAALTKEGLARPASTDVKKPWC